LCTCVDDAIYDPAIVVDDIAVAGFALSECGDPERRIIEQVGVPGAL
jgi:hypothetical protein